VDLGGIGDVAFGKSLKGIGYNILVKVVRRAEAFCGILWLGGLPAD